MCLEPKRAGIPCLQLAIRGFRSHPVRTQPWLILFTQEGSSTGNLLPSQEEGGGGGATTGANKARGYPALPSFSWLSSVPPCICPNWENAPLENEFGYPSFRERCSILKEIWERWEVTAVSNVEGNYRSRPKVMRNWTKQWIQKRLLKMGQQDIFHNV